MEDQEWLSVFRTRAEGLQDVWTLHMDDSIQPTRPEPEFYEYITRADAEFRCSGCGHSWASSRAHVVFHYSRDVANRRGSVKVRLCEQESRRCSVYRKEKPVFTRENIDMMVEKLIEEIQLRCYTENMEE